MNVHAGQAGCESSQLAAALYHGTTKQLAEKSQRKRQEVSGHDFSRAANGAF
jgi:hypothetical protein